MLKFIVYHVYAPLRYNKETAKQRNNDDQSKPWQKCLYKLILTNAKLLRFILTTAPYLVKLKKTKKRQMS